MRVIATAKYIRISPRKVRLVTDLITRQAGRGGRGHPALPAERAPRATWPRC